MGLLAGLLRLEGFVDLHELFLALAQQLLLRILAPDLDELEVVIQTFSHFINLSTAAASLKLQAAGRSRSRTSRHWLPEARGLKLLLLRVGACARQQARQVGRLGLDQP